MDFRTGCGASRTLLDFVKNYEISGMPHPVDIHVGTRIRYRRWQIGMTLRQLGKKVGIQHQQIQKYETGKNRVSASRLWEVSAAQSAPISFYFEGLNGQSRDSRPLKTDFPQGFHNDKKALDFVLIYFAIPKAQRRGIFELARSLSDDT